MPLTDLQKFQRRLALAEYFCQVFGVKDINESGSVRDFYELLQTGSEDPYNSEGRSHVYTRLQGEVRGISQRQLLRYDINVKRHTDELNRHRIEPIKLKYFQILAALMTEHYFDRLITDAHAFTSDLNAFVEKQREIRWGHKYLPFFDVSDLNKLAFWMATGSGKTLVMHLNYYQYLHYAAACSALEPENILLVTPGEGLSDQHIAEMEKSGIPCHRFNAETPPIHSASSHSVKVIEIHKLTQKKEGGGKSVEVSHLEGSNLVFVDEGHRGAGGKTWMNLRAAVGQSGFTFEYSATFGEAIGGGDVDLQEDYGKAILLHYSYPDFHKDGYGKDYRILNMRPGPYRELTDRYLVANLLAFYEQVRYFNQHTQVLYRTYNIRHPLLAFVGHTVTGGKTLRQVQSSPTDCPSFTDVQQLVYFLHRVLRNEDSWVSKAIDVVLSGDTGLTRKDGSDLFADMFRTLKRANLHGREIYSDMRQLVFHATGAVTGLQLVDLKAMDGEIGLRVNAQSPIFGLINIGNDPTFLQLAKEEMKHIPVKEERFQGSLFQSINQQGSSINVLIGAKKFIEGWDSWRVSTMGLMNIGRSEGPQVIQLFGRGVRLLGKDRTLKRSERLQGRHPQDIVTLETLNIFGVRADYMARFRRHLQNAGIDPGEWDEFIVDTWPGPDFENRGLLVIRPQTDTAFDETVNLLLQPGDVQPTIDLTPQAERLSSSDSKQATVESFGARESHTFRQEVLGLFNWERLYRDTWRFAAGRGYHNLGLDRKTLRSILAQEHYNLLCPGEVLELTAFADVERLEQIALMVLRKYVAQWYAKKWKMWRSEQLRYKYLDTTDENLVSSYRAQVRRSAEDLLAALNDMREKPSDFESDEGLPSRVHFSRHLYFPLLLSDNTNDPDFRYSPSGLNKGEREFVAKLRSYVNSHSGQELLISRDRELFLLRNQSRGHGVGFLLDNEGFFPDFVLWLQGPDRQDVVFVEPHGLLRDKQPKKNPKIQFYSQIKEYEQMLNERAGRDDVALHSYIISQTPYPDLSEHFDTESKTVLNSWHVYFPDQDYVRSIMEEILLADHPVSR